MNNPTIERYRHAVAMKSKAEEYRRTAVQHIDIYEAHYRLEHWKKEAQEAYEEYQKTISSNHSY